MRVVLFVVLACVFGGCDAGPAARELLFFPHDPATTEFYTLSLPDALPICQFYFFFLSCCQFLSFVL